MEFTSRREFIRKAGTIAGGICLGGMILPVQSCKPVTLLSGTKEGNAIRVAISQLEKSKSGTGVLRHDALPGPLYISSPEEGKYNAVLMICTHKQCEIKPSGKFLVCPCHGSEFKADGSVMTPPAQKPLKAYAAAWKGEFIEIEITD